MNVKKVGLLLSILLIFILALSACKQVVETTEVAEPTVVESAVPVAVESAEPVVVESAVPVVAESAVPVVTEAPTVLDPNRPLKIISVQHALCAWDSFWCTEQDAIQEAAKVLNVEVEILGPDKFDLEKTATLIEQAVAAKPDGLIVTITDADLFREPLLRAIDAGIPVVAFNSGAGPEADGIPYLTLFAQDEYLAGFQAAKRLATAAGDGKHYAVCINHGVGSYWGDTRCSGFADAMTELGITSEVLGIGDDPAESTTIIGDYYAAHPEADIFITLGPTGANPFYAFVENQGLTAADVTHGTFDLSPEIKEHIIGGLTQFGIDQQPYYQGFGAMTAVVQAARYGILPAMPITPTGPGFIGVNELQAELDPERSIKIISVQHALCAWDAFWCVVENGIHTAADGFGVEVEILGPDKFDLEKTATLIEQAVAAKPDGLIVTVTDADLFREPLQRAIDAGIPVVAFNSGAGPEADGIPYLTLFAQDEYLAGFQAAKRLATAAGDGKHYAVCINHGVGSYWGDTRCSGFADAMTELGITSEVLGIGDDPAESTTIIGDYYAAHPEADIFITLGPTGANPFYAFVENQGLTAADVTHGTFDLSPEINEHIIGGLTQFGIDQQPFLQGYDAIQTIVLLLRYGVTPTLPITPTGPGFVTIDNIDTVGALAGTYR